MSACIWVGSPLHVFLSIVLTLHALYCKFFMCIKRYPLDVHCYLCSHRPSCCKCLGQIISVSCTRLLLQDMCTVSISGNGHWEISILFFLMSGLGGVDLMWTCTIWKIPISVYYLLGECFFMGDVDNIL